MKDCGGGGPKKREIPGLGRTRVKLQKSSQFEEWICSIVARWRPQVSFKNSNDDNKNNNNNDNCYECYPFIGLLRAFARLRLAPRVRIIMELPIPSHLIHLLLFLPFQLMLVDFLAFSF
jgi:hypothetical protein